MTVKSETREGLRKLLGDLRLFSRGVWPQTALREYQINPAEAVVRAVRAGKGGALAWVFSRQSGKDEALAQLLAYLLVLYQREGGQIVVAAPTKRQADISRERLAARLDNGLTRGSFRQKDGYILALGRANVRFLSAAPSANVRGETASLLLVANECQDIDPDRWDAVFDPMAASTNAAALFLGTVWTSRTLLSRQIRFLKEVEKGEGGKRLFLVDWERVALTLPAYGERVRERIAQFGPEHPFIKTEYRLQELDGAGGLFHPARRALMTGAHPRREAAQPGKIYCLLVDVAGEDERSGTGPEGEAETRAANPRRDSTAVTVVEVLPEKALSSGELSAPGLPSYKVVNRYVWTGVKQTDLYGRIVGLARDTWQARLVVVDATGIGAGLASFLERALPQKTVPFIFSLSSKSELGWNFLGLIDSGRFKDYLYDGREDTCWYWKQLEAVEYEVRPGPGKLMRWSVPDPKLHDDLVMSAALAGVLDSRDWRSRKAVGL